MATSDGRKNPALLWYGFDFYADEAVKLMTWEQKGVYQFLLWHAWHEGSLPEDPADIAELLGMRRSRFNKVWPRIAPKWHPNEKHRLINHRLEREREKFAARSRRLSEVGTRANEIRWGSQGDPLGIPRGSLPSPSPSPNQPPEGGDGQPAAGPAAELARILIGFGFQAPWPEAIRLAKEGMSPDDLRRECGKVEKDPKARSKPAVLAHRLKDWRPPVIQHPPNLPLGLDSCDCQGCVKVKGGIGPRRKAQ